MRRITQQTKLSTGHTQSSIKNQPNKSVSYGRHSVKVTKPKKNNATHKTKITEKKPDSKKIGEWHTAIINTAKNKVPQKQDFTKFKTLSSLLSYLETNQKLGPNELDAAERDFQIVNLFLESFVRMMDDPGKKTSQMKQLKEELKKDDSIFTGEIKNYHTFNKEKKIAFFNALRYGKQSKLKKIEQLMNKTPEAPTALRKICSLQVKYPQENRSVSLLYRSLGGAINKLEKQAGNEVFTGELTTEPFLETQVKREPITKKIESDDKLQDLLAKNKLEKALKKKKSEYKKQLKNALNQQKIENDGRLNEAAEQLKAEYELKLNETIAQQKPEDTVELNEAIAQQKVEDETKLNEAVAKQKAEDDGKLNDAVAKQKAEDDGKLNEAIAQQKPEDTVELNEAIAQQKVEDETKLNEAVAKQKAEDDGKLNETIAKQKAEDDGKLNEAAVAKQKAEDDGKLNEAVAQQKAEDEAKLNDAIEQLKAEYELN